MCKGCNAVCGSGDPNREDGEYKQSIGLLHGIDKVLSENLFSECSVFFHKWSDIIMRYPSSMLNEIISCQQIFGIVIPDTFQRLVFSMTSVIFNSKRQQG